MHSEAASQVAAASAVLPDADLTSQIRAAFEAYLDAYLTRRDKAGVEAMMAPTVDGFGTGRHESTFYGLSPQELVRRDLSDAPNPLRFQIHHLAIRPMSADCGLVVTEMDVETQIALQLLRLLGVRMTLLFRHYQDGWKIEHLHVSLPTTAHGEEETYPVKELEERNAALMRLVGERTAQLHEALSHHRELAVTDPLTLLYNRRMLNEQLLNEAARAARYHYPVSVLLLDLDYFKRINDRWGHAQGDRVLVQFAELIRRRVRDSDVAGRWGGEEFLVLCHRTTLDEAMVLAEALRKKTAQTDFGLGEVQTVSIGVAQLLPGESVETLIARADAALYRAKASDRNCTCLAES